MAESRFADRTVTGAFASVDLWIRREGIDGLDVSEVRSDEILDYLMEHYPNRSSGANVRGHFIRFFDFCESRGYMKVNPARLVWLNELVCFNARPHLDPLPRGEEMQ
jgi:hypothetical protein